MTWQLKTSSLFLILVLASCTVSATAHSQSGRRQPKRPQAAPVPTPTPEPTPIPKKEETSDLGFVVGMDRGDSFTYYPISFYSAVLNSCAGRLTQASSAKVTTSDYMSRSDAIKKAKAEKTSYVVWLRLTSFNMRSSHQVNLDDVEIEFVVFTPVTGKIATSGRSYQNAARAGPIIVQPPGGSGGIYYREHLLKRAAEDAADRILRALHITTEGRFDTAKHSQPQSKAAQ